MRPISFTCSATAARIRSAIGFPLINVADIGATLESAQMRWPRKNDQSSIDARREAMGVHESLVTSVDLEPFAAAAESLVGVAVIPVSAVPIEIELGSYELDDEGGVVEKARSPETVH